MIRGIGLQTVLQRVSVPSHHDSPSVILALLVSAVKLYTVSSANLFLARLPLLVD